MTHLRQRRQKLVLVVQRLELKVHLHLAHCPDRHERLDLSLLTVLHDVACVLLEHPARGVKVEHEVHHGSDDVGEDSGPNELHEHVDNELRRRIVRWADVAVSDCGHRGKCPVDAEEVLAVLRNLLKALVLQLRDVVEAGDAGGDEVAAVRRDRRIGPGQDIVGAEAVLVAVIRRDPRIGVI